MRQGQGLFATQIVPPPVSGYDPNFLANTKYDPAGAKALLDKFGYIDRDKDGWRDMPDGKPLVLKRGTSPSALERQYDELWQRNMTAIGIRIEMVTQRWPDLLKMARNGQLQMWQLANTSSTTEGYGFLGTALRAERRARQPVALQATRVRSPVRRVQEAARRSAARQDGQGDVADRRRVRAVEGQLVPDRERRRVSVGDRLQIQSVQPAPVAISRHRSQDAAKGRRMMTHAAGAAVHRVRARRTGAGSREVGRSGEGAARRDHRSPRPASIRRRRRTSTRTRSIGDLRTAVRVRLPCAPASYRSADRGGAARDFRGRPHVEDPDPQRHLLRRRPGVQGREARAHRARLRVFDEAPGGPEGALAQRVHPARQARGSRRGAWRRPAASSTTTPRSRACARSIATRCSSSSSRPTTRSCRR